MGESVAHEQLAAGRAALGRGAWDEARSRLEDALAAGAGPEAHEALSWAAWWLEDVETCLEARERAYLGYRERGDRRAAARMALWLGDDHAEFRGAHAVAAGWQARAARLLETVAACPEHGWLAVFEAHTALDRRDLEEAERLAGQAREAGQRHGAVDLEMFALATLGVVRVGQGRVAEGLGHLDEAAAAALAGEYEQLAPAAWACCLVMATCEQVRDYDRAAQWCAQIEAFSERLGATFLRGVCRTHYGALRAWQGDWDTAQRELETALDTLGDERASWRADALVRLGELRRRQGRTDEAVTLFEQAGGHPLALRGLAAVHLDRGEPGPARDLLERALRRVPTGAVARADALELLVRALVEVGEHDLAAHHLDELRAIAAAVDTGPLWAAVDLAEGRRAMAAGEHERARAHLEDAVDRLTRGGAPLEAATARVALARTLQELGRHQAARREADLALQALGPHDTPDRAAATRLRAALDADGGTDRPLTPRQVEVLRLVARGLSDQQIADALVLSPHTVHRHLANIYVRLGCSTRAEAVASSGRLGLL
jgi:LuxR family transcriptional regulator, maltose regulon positive regulatory protein